MEESILVDYYVVLSRSGDPCGLAMGNPSAFAAVLAFGSMARALFPRRAPPRGRNRAQSVVAGNGKKTASADRP